jgi:hypothetical protein
MVICKICNEEFENYAFLSSHIRFKHKMTSYDYSLKYDYNGEIHKCKCGCGQETKWFNINIGFYDFVKGHDNTFRHQQLLIKKVCIICGTEFKTKNKDKVICTKRECYQKDLYNRTHEIRTCPCGEKFECSKTSPQIYHSFECSRKDPAMWEKMRQTLIETYGVDNYSKTEEFKECARENSYFKTEEFQVKAKKTKEERYDDENYNNRPKAVNSNLKFYFNNLFTSDRLKNLVTPLFTIDDYKGVDKIYQFKCNRCDNIFESNLFHIPRCLECFPFKKNTSEGEIELFNYIKSLIPNENIIQNDIKTLPNNLEIDIYIPNLNIAFEYNGIYWHSAKFKNYNYHKWKYEKCKEQNIQLIQIFENEWIFKKEIVKSIIKNKLKLIKNKIYARKCEIKEINSQESNSFLFDNHIQGIVNTQYKFGLFYNDKLISLMTIGKSRFDKKYEYEIIRFCNKINYSIIGGFNKLLSYFIKTYNPNSIISYVDKRYFTGNMYNQTDFKLIESYNKPNYFYFKGYEMYNRIEFQKHKLKDKLEIYDENLTEWQNMELNGYNKIYDCGNFKYVWEK